MAAEATDKRLLRELAGLLRANEEMVAREDPTATLLRELEGLGECGDDEAMIKAWCSGEDGAGGAADEEEALLRLACSRDEEASGEKASVDEEALLRLVTDERPGADHEEVATNTSALEAEPPVPGATSEALRAEILAAKRRAVALKREGNLDGARAELRRAKALEATLLSL